MTIELVKRQNPSNVTQFIEKIERGRKGILHKLASAMLRENIENMYEEAIDLEKIGSAIIVKIKGKQELPKYFFQEIQKYPLREEITYKVFRTQRSMVVFPIKDAFAFQRIETTDEILNVTEDGITSLTLASELLNALYAGVQKPENMDTFVQELDNGTANLTMAYMFDAIWKKEIQQEARALDASDTMDYLVKKRQNHPDFSSSLFFEQLVLEGHHLHPGAKTKMGLSERDVFRYSPEFHHTFNVHFVAVERTHVTTTNAQQNQLLEAHFPEELALCCRDLEQKGEDPAHYEILPVHEWQYRNAIPEIYEREIQSGQVILIDSVKVEAEATSSFRTVFLKNRCAPALKLAVNSQMTSTVRSISPQTALNSTRFTEMMTTILEKEPHLSRFIPLNEIAGAAFNSVNELKSRNLTMLMRENIDAKLEDGELAVAGPALYASSPLNGKPIIIELLNQYAEGNNLTKNRAAFPFFEEYVSTILPGYLTLMVKYGIALEGHLQNSVPVFKNGRLTRFFFRDWGGARIFRERLTQRGIDPTFTPGSISVTDDLDEMHNKLYYTVFQNHIGEIIRLLVQHTGTGEEELWNQVKAVCRQVLHSLRAEDRLEENIALDEAFLFQPYVSHKALTKMRLSNGKGYSYCKVRNPLHRLDGSHD